MRKVITEIKNFLKDYEFAIEFFNILSEAANIYIIGGILREYYEKNKIENIRDIDLIINIKNDNIWNELVNKYENKINTFGGYKFLIDGIKFDVWRIEDTWAYKNNIVKSTPKQYVEKLQYTVFLNVDSIIYDVDNNRWYNELYIMLKKAKVLDVVLEENPHIELNILRAILFKRNYKMVYSNRLKSIINKKYNSNPTVFVSELMKIQQSRYNKKMISKTELKYELKQIQKEIDIKNRI